MAFDATRGSVGAGGEVTYRAVTRRGRSQRRAGAPGRVGAHRSPGVAVVSGSPARTYAAAEPTCRERLDAGTTFATVDGQQPTAKR